MHATERVATCQSEGLQRVDISLPGLLLTSATRLTQAMPMYEKWHVNSLRFRYTPEAAGLVSGTMHMAFDYDPEDIAPQSPDQMAAFGNYVAGRVSNPHTLLVPNYLIKPGEYLKQPLYTSPEVETRLSAFGVLYHETSGYTTPNTVVGYIDMEYDIEFWIPQPARATVVNTTDVHSIAANTEVYNFACNGLEKVRALGGTSAATNVYYANPELQNLADERVSVSSNQLYSAVIDSFVNGAAAYVRNTPLRPGDRIFFRSTEGGTKITSFDSNQRTVVGTGDSDSGALNTVGDAVSALLGRAALDRGLNQLLNLVMPASSAIILTKVQRYTA